MSEEISAQAGDLERLEDGLDRLTGGALTRMEYAKSTLEQIRSGAEQVAGGLKQVNEKADSIQGAIATITHVIDLLQETRAYYGDERVGLNLRQARRMTQALCTVIEDLNGQFENPALEIAGQGCGLALYAIDHAMPVYETLLDRNQQAIDAGLPPPYPYALDDPEQSPEEVEYRRLSETLVGLREQRAEIQEEKSQHCGGIHTSYQAARDYCRRRVGDPDDLRLDWERTDRTAQRWRQDHDRIYANLRSTSAIERELE